MDVADYYRTFQSAADASMSLVLADTAKLKTHTVSYNFLADLDKLRTAIDYRPEAEMLSYAAREYELALFLLVQGQYRPAFSGLRLFLELSLASIQFSASEIDYWRWAAEKRDLYWQSMTDESNGIFSAHFIEAFFPEISEHGKQFGALARAVYRELSQYVHGNPSTHSSVSDGLAFDETMFERWHSHAESCRIVLIFAFSSRFLMKITRAKANELEEIVFDSLGNLKPIREFYERGTGDE
jgi:hypothetical protein